MAVLQTYELVLQLGDLGRERFQEVCEHCDDFQLSTSVIRECHTIDCIVSSPDSTSSSSCMMMKMTKMMILTQW